jgi:hypothetical protein
VFEISQIIAGQQLGYKYYLAGMLGEMLDHLIDRFHFSDLVILNGHSLREPCRVEFSNDIDRLGDRLARALNKLRRLEAAARRKFPVTIPLVRQVADSETDPLTNVAAQVQNQVADGVNVLGVAGPDLIVVEPANAIFDAAA